MKEHWESRYAQEEFSYGTEPNIFLRKSLTSLPTGKILLPGEGEGRNAIHAASQGWEVDAFDFSEKGREKALGLASEQGVSLNYVIGDYASYEPKVNHYDAVGLIYTHTTPEIRPLLHLKMANALKPGGKVVLQAFSKSQLGKSTGGPKQLDMLFSIEELSRDFAGLTIELLEEVDVELSEGIYHRGVGSVINMIAKKE